MAHGPNRFLGIDLSTQSITAVVIDPDGRDLQEFGIDFDAAYPAYGTTGGVVFGDRPAEVGADPRMWVEALEGLLGKLKTAGITASVKAVAVSAQQHGSVYLKDGFDRRLAALDPERPLVDQLADGFSRSFAPVWMDSSTHAECAEITGRLGGDARVAELTGSVATERFAGPQIRKFWKSRPQRYALTAHIALISSFLTGLLAGRIAPVDGGDGFGTNLADIRNRCWSPAALAAAAPGLLERLPPLVTRDETLGVLAPYLVQRFGFGPTTRVVVGSGDNPCSLVGLGLIGDQRKRAVSLGTSDTYFGYLPELDRRRPPVGHVFGTADGGHMVLLCFKNGSLARDRIRNDFGLSWQAFSELLLNTPAGNHGRVLLPYFLPEITPRVLEPAVRRFGELPPDDAAGNVRAVVEAQVAAMYRHSAWTGQRPQTVLVTAGGSENAGILHVIAQVFDAAVVSFEVKNSAALGAAVRAAHRYFADTGRPRSWAELSDPFLAGGVAGRCNPHRDQVAAYHGPNGFISVHAACERCALQGGPDPAPAIAAFRSAFDR